MCLYCGGKVPNGSSNKSCRSSPDLCFATKSIKSMTKDIDLNVTQVGRDGKDNVG